jgi:hypothetical protein
MPDPQLVRNSAQHPARLARSWPRRIFPEYRALQLLLSSGRTRRLSRSIYGTFRGLPGRRARRRQQATEPSAMPTVDGGRVGPAPTLPSTESMTVATTATTDDQRRDSADSSERGRPISAAGQDTQAGRLHASARLTGRRRPLGRHQASHVQWPLTAPTSTCFCLDETLASDRLAVAQGLCTRPSALEVDFSVATT